MGAAGGEGCRRLLGWETALYPFLLSHLSEAFFFFLPHLCGKSRAKAWLISSFPEPGFRTLKGHPVSSFEILTSTQSPPRRPNRKGSGVDRQARAGSRGKMWG